MKTTIELAREAGLEISHTPPFFIRAWEEELKAFADLVRADERERIIAANAREIERVNAHIKALEAAIRARSQS
jgi:hypothetical protein